MPEWFDRMAARAAEFNHRVKYGMITGSTIDKEIGGLTRRLKDNRNIKDLSEHPGWHELDEELSNRAVTMLRELPKLILAGKNDEALASAALITSFNDVLGLVNRTVFESKLVASLIDSRLTIKEKIAERTK